MNKSRVGKIAIGVSVSVLAISMVFSPAAAVVPTQAGAVIQVTTETDEMDGNNACSLREAITAANTDSAVDSCAAGNGADTIELPAGTYVLTIAGQADDENLSGDFDLLAPLAIVGAGAGSTVVDGGALDRVFHVDASAGDVSLAGVSIRNGRTGDADQLPGGGGILNYATLALTDVVIDDNGAGGFISYQGGGILNYGNLTLQNVSILNNWAEIDGLGAGLVNRGQVIVTGSLVSGNHTWDAAGIFNSLGATAVITNTRIENNTGSNWGCGVVSNGSLTMENSVVIQNNCPQGSGLLVSAGTATVSDSHISANSAELGAGILLNGGTVSVSASAVYLNLGSGVTVLDGELAILNSTISGNQAAVSGAGLVAAGGTTSLNNVTITENVILQEGVSDSDGGGIAVTGGYVSLHNSILAENHDLTPDSNAPDLHVDTGTVVSEGYNLIGVGSPELSGVEGDQIGSLAAPVLPILSPLADHDGPTPTHLLLNGSPAIDNGDPLNCPPSDQRGYSRPADGDQDSRAVCDVGAVELLLTASEFTLPILIYLPVMAN